MLIREERMSLLKLCTAEGWERTVTSCSKGIFNWTQGKKTHHKGRQALKQTVKWGWAPSTLWDLRNSDRQVSEKLASTSMLISLWARSWMRWPPGVPPNLYFSVILKEFPIWKSPSPPYKSRKWKNLQKRYHGLASELMQTKLCPNFSTVTLKMNLE